VVPLTAPADADPGASSGCATIPADLASALAKNPSKYYFNLHSMPKFRAAPSAASCPGDSTDT
jgi:hypothetical protein